VIPSLILKFEAASNFRIRIKLKKGAKCFFSPSYRGVAAIKVIIIIYLFIYVYWYLLLLFTPVY
jgi:hypothetical protein